jgi:hypothetical protein
MHSLLFADGNFIVLVTMASPAPAPAAPDSSGTVQLDATCSVTYIVADNDVLFYAGHILKFFDVGKGTTGAFGAAAMVGHPQAWLDRHGVPGIPAQKGTPLFVRWPFAVKFASGQLGSQPEKSRMFTKAVMQRVCELPDEKSPAQRMPAPAQIVASLRQLAPKKQSDIARDLVRGLQSQDCAAADAVFRAHYQSSKPHIPSSSVAEDSRNPSRLQRERSKEVYKHAGIVSGRERDEDLPDSEPQYEDVPSSPSALHLLSPRSDDRLSNITSETQVCESLLTL